MLAISPLTQPSFLGFVHGTKSLPTTIANGFFLILAATTESLYLASTRGIAAVKGGRKGQAN